MDNFLFVLFMQFDSEYKRNGVLMSFERYRVHTIKFDTQHARIALHSSAIKTQLLSEVNFHYYYYYYLLFLNVKKNDIYK